MRSVFQLRGQRAKTTRAQGQDMKYETEPDIFFEVKLINLD